MIASYFSFLEVDPIYAGTLLEHGTTLYNFAKTFQGLYSSHNEDAEEYYNSINYTDELCIAAVFLYKATNH